jgi:hypothetical protein
MGIPRLFFVGDAQRTCRHIPLFCLHYASGREAVQTQMDAAVACTPSAAEMARAIAAASLTGAALGALLGACINVQVGVPFLHASSVGMGLCCGLIAAGLQAKECVDIQEQDNLVRRMRRQFVLPGCGKLAELTQLRAATKQCGGALYKLFLHLDAASRKNYQS